MCDKTEFRTPFFCFWKTLCGGASGVRVLAVVRVRAVCRGVRVGFGKVGFPRGQRKGAKQKTG